MESYEHIKKIEGILVGYYNTKVEIAVSAENLQIFNKLGKYTVTFRRELRHI